ncbi:MAG: DUF3253 domain-containing protein [Alphaproteobacteria bacterium]|nr:DUF3253 domain-containing protein [Alphaproteobacteria bacterium]
MAENEEKPLDPVAETILSALSRLKKEELISPENLAKAVAESRRKPNDGPQLWRRYFNATKQQCVHLARTGRIEIVRKGEVADPNDLKGLWKVRAK